MVCIFQEFYYLVNVPDTVVFNPIKIAKSERFSLFYGSASSFSSYTNFKSAKILSFSYISVIENCILILKLATVNALKLWNIKYVNPPVTVLYGA